MNAWVDVTAYGTTGAKTINVGFPPKYIRMVISKKYNVAETCAHQSDGSSDGFVQCYDSFYYDASGGTTKNGFNKMASHWERIGGVLAEVVAITFVAFTATGVQFNVTTANINYNIRIEILG